MNQQEIISNIIGITLILTMFYLLTKNKTNKSAKKIHQLITDFHLNFYKISDKKCSVKRLNKVNQIEIKDNSYLFDKCDIYIENDFVLIQGFKETFYKYNVRSFILTNNLELFKKKFNNWAVLQPIFVEFNTNKTQVKIVYTANTNNSDYSLIINDLNSEDYNNLHQIKNYCKKPLLV